MNKKTRNLLIIVGGLVLVIAVAAIAGRGKGHGAIEVRTQKLAWAPFTVKLPENGVVMHQRAATIPVLVSGNIGRILVRAGSQVGAGDLLATIYNPAIDYTAAGSAADEISADANVTAAR